MALDEQQQVCMDSSSCDKLPPLSSSKKYPWFIVQNLEHEDDMCTEFFSTLHDPLLKFQSQIPELYRKRIRGCFYGWLIISNHPDNVMWSLWNPVSLKTVNLPPLRLKDEDGNKCIRECLLTAPPDDPTCVVLLTRCDAPTFVFCHLINRSKRKRMRWTEMSYDKQLKRITYNGKLLRNLCCCNGKIYALSTDASFCMAVIQVVVKRDRVGEVMIQLVMFGACPEPVSRRCIHHDLFIRGGEYGKKECLFCIIVCYYNGTNKIGDVYLFRLDTGSLKWEDLECLKKWDMTGLIMEDMEYEDSKDLSITQDMWEEMNDLKDTAIFYVDLGRDRTIFYNPAVVVSDELLGGGYIHIRDKMDGILHLYNVRDRTIIPSPMPSRVVSTTHVSMWEGTRLEEEDDHVEANCTGTSVKQEKDERVVVVTLDEGVLNDNESSRLLDVLEPIMERCVGVEYLNLRATCKFCRLALPLIRWRNEPSRTRLHNYSLTSPWLMVANKHRGGTISFTDPLSGDNYFVKKNSQVLSSIVDDRMYCSRYGWLLFESREYKCPVLFNPFTSDVRKLPNFGEILCLCFSASPTTNSSSLNNNNCIVAGFAYDEGQDNLIYYSVGVGGDQWRFVPLGNNDDWHIYASLTFIGRDLYALGEGGQVIVFKNLGGEERMIKKTVLANAPPLKMISSSDSLETRNYFLMSCDDEHLLLVIMGDECGEIEVFKKRNDNEDDKWEKIDGIGKHTIFIGGTTSICVDAKKPEMENKIYFSQLVWYSLETHTYHASSDPGKIMKRYFHGFVGAKSHFNCHAWIQPNWC